MDVRGVVKGSGSVERTRKNGQEGAPKTPSLKESLQEAEASKRGPSERKKTRRAAVELGERSFSKGCLWHRANVAQKRTGVFCGI